MGAIGDTTASAAIAATAMRSDPESLDEADVLTCIV
jgi:hypothetical protein